MCNRPAATLGSRLAQLNLVAFARDRAHGHAQALVSRALSMNAATCHTMKSAISSRAPSGSVGIGLVRWPSPLGVRSLGATAPRLRVAPQFMGSAGRSLALACRRLRAELMRTARLAQGRPSRYSTVRQPSLLRASNFGADRVREDLAQERPDIGVAVASPQALSINCLHAAVERSRNEQREGRRQGREFAEVDVLADTVTNDLIQHLDRREIWFTSPKDQRFSGDLHSSGEGHALH
jgi:hypothetical protein